MSVSFYVFYEDPFWIGLFSITEEENNKYCRVVFGSEPTDIELYQFILKKFNSLKFSDIEQPFTRKVMADNPKRRQKQVAKELKSTTGTARSYETIKESLKAGKKTLKREARKSRKDQDRKNIFAISQRNRKEKHKGH